MILLDTHTLCWVMLENRKIGKRARAAIDRAWARKEAAVSAISFWEASMQFHRGKLKLPAEAAAWRRSLLRDGLRELPVTGEIAARAGDLTSFHADPADCIIMATAMEGHTLVTADSTLLDWPVEAERLDAQT